MARNLNDITANTQSSFSGPGFKFSSRLVFGGSLLKKSHAKSPRHLTPRAALQVVMHSEHTRGPFSLLKRERVLRNTVYAQGKKFGVKVYHLRISQNDVHLLVR